MKTRLTLSSPSSRPLLLWRKSLLVNPRRILRKPSRVRNSRCLLALSNSSLLNSKSVSNLLWRMLRLLSTSLFLRRKKLPRPIASLTMMALHFHSRLLLRELISLAVAPSTEEIMPSLSSSKRASLLSLSSQSNRKLKSTRLLFNSSLLNLSRSNLLRPLKIPSPLSTSSHLSQLKPRNLSHSSRNCSNNSPQPLRWLLLCSTLLQILSLRATGFLLSSQTPFLQRATSSEVILHLRSIPCLSKTECKQLLHSQSTL
mmetsp:Transcript_6210/g.10091  ORF Transcript_6210/g.10091 Transcript_6210/m.10091 type:complete len:257 (-) Transcript_6210:375-1145(-)